MTAAGAAQRAADWVLGERGDRGAEGAENPPVPATPALADGVTDPARPPGGRSVPARPR